MVNMETIRRLNHDDMEKLIAVLELNEDRLYAWLVLGSVTVVRDDLDGAIEYVKTLREMIRTERPNYVSPYESVLPI